ncbi:MAG: organoarsenical effux MFS transporter ArsJ [Kangiellaceae bacterium]
MSRLQSLPESIKQYLLITFNYWAFTLTDGALRMLVLLYFHQLGYSPFQLASLFIFYEFFGMVTNVVGGWLGARIGLNKTMNIGLGLQLIALSMLLIPSEWITVLWVMCAQAISGVAKDLNKMSAKSTIKFLVDKESKDQLFKWVAAFTGSKNTLKGVGFFLGGFLLNFLGFFSAVLSMVMMLALIWLFSVVMLKKEFGKVKNKPKFSQIFSNNSSLNFLSVARLFLFAARDVWFVIALPVYLSNVFSWSFTSIGTFMAFWIIGYGIVQSAAPKLFNSKTSYSHMAGKWAFGLSVFTIFLTFALNITSYAEPTLMIGLTIFGIIFAINSSLHSFLVVDLASRQGVSMDVGFYYMANASGRLMGTILSGYLYQKYGLEACVVFSSGFLLLASVFVFRVNHDQIK